MAISLRHVRPINVKIKCLFSVEQNVYSKRCLPKRCLHQRHLTRSPLGTPVVTRVQCEVNRHVNKILMLSSAHMSSSPDKSEQALNSAGDGYYIPEPPTVKPPTDAIDISSTLNALGEPSLQSLGLGSNYPPGLVQQALDFLHVSCDMPWFSAIVAGTIVLRLVMIPVLVFGQREMIKYQNFMPQFQGMNEKIMAARASNDQAEYFRLLMLQQHFMRSNNINPFKQLIAPICQIPVFLSVFVGLRGMANLPIESMKTGGIFWFTDLTVPDPYFLLPLVTATTLLVTLEVGADGIQGQTRNQKMLMRILPFVSFPIMINFPTALCVYWCTANFVSLTTTAVLKIPAVRKKLNLPDRKTDLASNKHKGKLIQTFKEEFREKKKMHELKERERLDQHLFQKAGEGPLKKTYPLNHDFGNKKNSVWEKEKKENVNFFRRRFLNLKERFFGS